MNNKDLEKVKYIPMLLEAAMQIKIEVTKLKTDVDKLKAKIKQLNKKVVNE